MELVVQSGPDTGKVFQIGYTPLVAGRQAGTDIVLNDTQISRRHVQFELINGRLMVNDLGSANGTRINNQPLAPNVPRPLVVGDTVQLGNSVLVVRDPGLPGSEAPAEKTEMAGFGSAFPASPPAPGAYPPQAQPFTPPPVYGANNLPVQPPPVSPAQNYLYQTPAPVYSQPSVPYNQPAPGPGFYPAPPPAPKRKGGLLVAGLLGIMVLSAAAIGGIVAMGNSPSKVTPTSAVFLPPAPTGNPPTPVPVVTPTPAVGSSGTNPVPPSPPAAAPSPTPRPTVAARPTTAAATNPGSGSTPAEPTSALGLTITFPPGWQTITDESKNIIESSSPDGVTYSEVRSLSGFSGSAKDRLTRYLSAIQSNFADLKIIRAVNSPASNANLADAYITYTDKQDNLLHRDYIVAASAASGDTYFIRFSTEDKTFDTQVDTFNNILKSIEV